MADSQVLKALLPDNPLCGISTYKDALNLATGACTRQIYKLVLHGTESYGKNVTGTYQYYMAVNPLHKKVPICVCSHLPSVDDYPADVIGVHTTRWANNAVYLNFGEDVMLAQPSGNTVDGLKEYITAQYNAGTPVTIWYIMETATTETITVPSGLTGTVEGYLNQDGTPTPTNPIYPTANEVEIWVHSLRKLTTATEAVENPLYSDGTPITSYTIKGNTVQNGTPTPSNPVEVNGVGNKTANLFDVNGTYSLKSNSITITNNSIAATLGGSATDRIYYTQTYTAGTYKISFDVQSCEGRLYSNKEFTGSTYNSYYEGYYRTITGVQTITFAEDFIIGFILAGPSGANAVISSIMFQTSTSTADYEPYGYKIPISSGGVTTNIYLGSAQSTRQIKKFVFDGSEYWQLSTSYVGACWIFLQDLDNNIKPRTQAICSHLASADGNYRYGTCNIDHNAIGLWLFNEAKTIDEIKNYIHEQYINGTPITLWCILDTAKTDIVNEPLMKIGDYVDTLSNATAIPTTDGANSITVDTTVQPSEFTATWSGWHDSSVQEYVGGVGLNKFLPPLEATSETINGVTFTVNTNGTVTIDGTASAAANFKYRLKGDMVVPTSKQMGGDAYMYFFNDFTSGGTIRFLYNDTMIDYWSINPANRVLSKFDNLENQTINTVEIRIPSGETRHNATLSVMLTNDGEQAAAFEPYEYAWV